MTDGNRPSKVQAVLNTNEDGAKRHIYFEIDGGDKCDDTQTYTTRYEITCDASITEKPKLTAENLNLTEPCRPKLTFAHKTGCPVFEATSIVRFLAENPYVLGAILIFLGAIVTFYGGKFFPMVLAGITGGVTFFVVLLLASVLGLLVALDKGKSSSGGEIALCVLSFVVAGGAGALAGMFIHAIRRIGLMFLGATAGFFIGFLLYTFVFAQWLQHVAVLATLCFLCSVALGYLTYKYDKLLIVYLTSFLGAYAFIRGISMYAGKYPNEIFLYQQLSNNAFDGLGYEFYLYLASMVITGVLGVFHQKSKGFHKHGDDDYYKQE